MVLTLGCQSNRGQLEIGNKRAPSGVKFPRVYDIERMVLSSVSTVSNITVKFLLALTIAAILYREHEDR